MATPAFEAFKKSARNSLAKACCDDRQSLASFDKLGSSFDFYDDGGIDSLDMLDVSFFIEQDLHIKLEVEKLMNDEEPMTLQNLYHSIRQDSNSPA